MEVPRCQRVSEYSKVQYSVCLYECTCVCDIYYKYSLGQFTVPDVAWFYFTLFTVFYTLVRNIVTVRLYYMGMEALTFGKEITC